LLDDAREIAAENGIGRTFRRLYSRRGDSDAPQTRSFWSVSQDMENSNDPV
jgi:hypothetical protein